MLSELFFWLPLFLNYDVTWFCLFLYNSNRVLLLEMSLGSFFPLFLDAADLKSVGFSFSILVHMTKKRLKLIKLQTSVLLYFTNNIILT